MAKLKDILPLLREEQVLDISAYPGKTGVGECFGVKAKDLKNNPDYKMYLDYEITYLTSSETRTSYACYEHYENGFITCLALDIKYRE